ncbi:MAG: hypothetical protein U0Y08_10195 [Bacteroidia bacterium]
MKKMIRVATVMILLLNATAHATISAVQLQAGINVPQNLSRNLAVSNNRIQGFRLPFVTGVSHVVDLTGAFLDVCDRVEICNASGTKQRTISGTGLNKFKSNNEGHVKFTVNSSDLPGIETDFIIKVRYAVELTGYDQLDCKVAGRGVVNSIQWTGSPLPSIIPFRKNGGETSLLKSGTVYTLQFNGTGFTNQVQLHDGLRSNLFGKTNLPFSSSDLTVNAAGTTITLTVRPSGTAGVDIDLENFTDITKNLLFVYGGVGNINGGWGPYLVYDYNNLMSNAGVLTDLKRIEAAAPSTFFPELKIQGLTNLFTSNGSVNGQFSDADLAKYQLCNLTATSNIKTTVIPDLQIVIENTGNVASPATTLRVTNGAGVQIGTINVPSIPIQSTTTVTYVRPISTVCGQGVMKTPLVSNVQANKASCVFCSGAASNNLAFWTDSGLIFDITAVAGEQNPGNNRMIVQ